MLARPRGAARHYVFFRGGSAMAETARLAVFHGTGRPFEIREYPVPDPEPGAMLIKISLANVCGSDMHYWRGEQDYVKMGRPLPLNTGHEHMGTVAKLGQGVSTDSTGQPLKVGDRVLYRYFCPCGHCKACLRRQYKSVPPARPTGSFPARCGRTSRAASASTSTSVRITRSSRSVPRSPTRWRRASIARTRRCTRGWRSLSSAPGRRWWCRARGG